MKAIFGWPLGWIVGQISVAGKLAEISPAGQWWASIPKSQWDVEDESIMNEITTHWQAPYGDRRQELVFIGTDIDKAAIQGVLKPVSQTMNSMLVRKYGHHTMIPSILGNLYPKTPQSKKEAYGSESLTRLLFKLC